MSESLSPFRRVHVTRVGRGSDGPREDLAAAEEPLEVRLRATKASSENATLSLHGAPLAPRGKRSVAVTMRTPGADFELAAGFLYGEGVIRNREEIESIAHCDDLAIDETQRFNIVNVDLRTAVLPDLDTLQRHFHTTSACGVCGKKNIDSLRFSAPAPIYPNYFSARVADEVLTKALAR